MSDPRLDAELTIDGTTYLLRFTNSALQHAEKLTGKDVQTLFVTVMSGHIPMSVLSGLLTAGLEGARRKLRLGGKPWTNDAVADLLDDADSFDHVAEPVIDAWDAAMRKWFPPVEQDDEPEDPPAAAGDGTTSSEPPSGQG